MSKGVLTRMQIGRVVYRENFSRLAMTSFYKAHSDYQLNLNLKRSINIQGVHTYLRDLQSKRTPANNAETSFEICRRERTALGI